MKKKSLFISIVRYILGLFLIFAIVLGFVLWWAVGETLPWRSDLHIESDHDAIDAQAKPAITVATYNIGHGQGIKKNAWDFRDKEVTIAQLEKIAQAMKKIDADIFLLQEVDLDSDRTQRIDEIQFLKKYLSIPYTACALVWKKNYVPFPYWPPKHHIGYVRSANCILSKYKLKNHQSEIFSKPKNNPFWYNWGYIDRGVHKVDAVIGDQEIAIFNVHLEAWDPETREQQIRSLKAFIDETKLPIILGGDFNTLMPTEEKKSGFIDEPEVDFSKEKTLTWFFEEEPALKFPAKRADHLHALSRLTFPSDHPTRQIDHIFIRGKELEFIDVYAAGDAFIASDHLPLVAKIAIHP